MCAINLLAEGEEKTPAILGSNSGKMMLVKASFSQRLIFGKSVDRS